MSRSRRAAQLVLGSCSRAISGHDRCAATSARLERTCLLLWWDHADVTGARSPEGVYELQINTVHPGPASKSQHQLDKASSRVSRAESSFVGIVVVLLRLRAGLDTSRPQVVPSRLIIATAEA